jgi:hypothetical protein
MFIYRVICVRENKKRDAVGEEAFDNAYDDDLTDKKVSKASSLDFESLKY